MQRAPFGLTALPDGGLVCFVEQYVLRHLEHYRRDRNTRLISSGGDAPELFIEGEWRSARGGREREIRCPADGVHVVTVDEAGPEDTHDAIAAARRAFDAGDWSGTSVHD